MCTELLRLDLMALAVAFPAQYAQRDHDEIDVFSGLRVPGHDALLVHVEDDCRHTLRPPDLTYVLAVLGRISTGMPVLIRLVLGGTIEWS